jgi:uncharacterized repeat protein (TIGR03803 family)
MNPDGSDYRTIWSFQSGFAGGQGAQPKGTILGSDGYLYGATAEGGTTSNGTIFRVATDGSGYTILHPFTVTFEFPFFVGDGEPTELIEGSDGVLYGACLKGTATEPGMIFRINRDGTGYKVLHRFQTRNREILQATTLIEGDDQRLYGTKIDEGQFGKGIVFRINRDGSEYRVLHAFGGNDAEGRFPRAPLIRGGAGSFFGTTSEGGVDGAGTIFSISTSPLGPLRITRTSSGASIFGEAPAGVSVEVQGIEAFAPRRQWRAVTNLVVGDAQTFELNDISTDQNARFYRALLK